LEKTPESTPRAPAGIPAVTHASKASTLVVGGGAPGGIEAVVARIRATLRCP
jgi:hypothetical protein